MSHAGYPSALSVFEGAERLRVATAQPEHEFIAVDAVVGTAASHLVVL